MERFRVDLDNYVLGLTLTVNYECFRVDLVNALELTLTVMNV
jgi:hypothetical protein